uniref:Uncharacterized protein n=1 Tax=Rhizophora mucronata TaxID=61149 RepID=A0A2P2NRF4_RHIMU
MILWSFDVLYVWFSRLS